VGRCAGAAAAGDSPLGDETHARSAGTCYAIGGKPGVAAFYSGIPGSSGTSSGVHRWGSAGRARRGVRVRPRGLRHGAAGRDDGSWTPSRAAVIGGTSLLAARAPSGGTDVAPW